MNKQIFRIHVLILGMAMFMPACSFKKSHGSDEIAVVKKAANEDEIQTVLAAKLEKNDLSGALNYALYNNLSLEYIIKEKDKSIIDFVEAFPVQEISKSSNVSLLQSIQKKNPVNILKNKSILVVAGKSLDREFFLQTIKSLSGEALSAKDLNRDEISSLLEEVALEAVDNKTFGEIIEDGRLAQRFDWIKFKMEALGKECLAFFFPDF